jgi:hypothetical protein
MMEMGRVEIHMMGVPGRELRVVGGRKVTEDDGLWL